MAELCLCSSKVHFSTLLITDFLLLFSFTLSHPLYFSYFLFFSPYLFRLVSFLSPLFFTTSLLFCTFLTTIGQENFSASQSCVAVLVRACTSSLGISRSKNDHLNEEFQSFEYLTVYEILFGSLTMESDENPVEIMEEKLEEDHSHASESAQMDDPGIKDNGTGKIESFDENKEVINPVPATEMVKFFGLSMEEEKLVNFLKILYEFESLSSRFRVEGEEKKKASPSPGTKNSEVVKTMVTTPTPDGGYEAEEDRVCTLLTTNSQRISPNLAHSFHLEESKKIVKVRNCSSFDHKNLPSSGSMRKEKEWKRTLACKLFEERHGGGHSGMGQGMDSLWEAYEVERNIPAPVKDRKKKGSKARKKSEMEEEGGDGPFCCLQALEFSSGKMHFGIGRPNLVRMSKVMKGIGWMQHVSKKVHNAGDK